MDSSQCRIFNDRPGTTGTLELMQDIGSNFFIIQTIIVVMNSDALAQGFVDRFSEDRIEMGFTAQDQSEAVDGIIAIIHEHLDIREYYDKSGKGRNHCRDYGNRMWNATSVLEVLYNAVYIGKVINNKVEYNLDTNHKTIAKDESDWIVVENCHEPIVTQELYNKAHKAIGRRPYMKRNPTGKWKRAFIVCGHCGKGMDKYNNGKSYRCHNRHTKLVSTD